MSKKIIFLILIFVTNIYECKISMEENVLEFFENMKEQYEQISKNMEYIGNRMKTEKSLILDIKNTILKSICPNGKCIYNKKAMFNKFIEKIHENLKKLNQLGINVKSLNVDTALFFF